MSAVEVGQPLTAEQARVLTDEIKGALYVAWDSLINAWQGRADQALGYDCWDAYCATEFAKGRMVRLAREQRQEIVATMRSAGMSTRAISAGLGVSQRTAARDVPTEPDDSDDVPTVTSLDGRRRPANNVRAINANTPQALVDQDRDESERALPAYHVGGLVNELLSKPIDDPDGLIRNLPDQDRHVLDRVPEAIDYLTRIDQARSNA